MLKKISAIFLVLASGLMITATSVRADLAPPGGIDTSPPLLPIPSMPNYYPPQYIPQTLSLLKLEAVADHRRYYDTRHSISIPGGYFAYEAPKSLLPTASDFAYFNYFLPLYLIIFALNYVIEYGVGLFFKISKRPRFALMVLLMNLATHPLFTLTLITNFEDIANNNFLIGLIELLIVAAETLIIYLWLRRCKPKKSPAVAFVKSLKFCFTLNFISFLVGELIAWITVSSDIIDYYGLCLIVAFIITIIICIFKYPRRKAKPKDTI